MVLLADLPTHVLEHIAYHLALLDPLGPPSHLVPLLATCSRIYNHISFNTNPHRHLYARIFRSKFDHRAPARRLHDEATYSHAHAHQLVAYSRALSNIRRGDIYSPTLLHDLYRAFTLFLENDGRNLLHLLWARLPSFVEHYILARLWDARQDSHGWPLENGENTFALWLFWFCLNQQQLQDMSPQHRDNILFLIRPFAIYNFRYPPFLAPDNHVHLPLHGRPSDYHDHSAITPHGFYPLYRDPHLLRHKFDHYGARISIAEPPIGLVAKLLYISLNEHKPLSIPSFLPIDRPNASPAYHGPTRADFLDFASRWAVALPETDRALAHWDRPTTPNELDPDQQHPTPGKPHSARHDNDWERWRKCSDPWDVARTSLPVYTFGSLSGLWGGLYLVPDLGNYLMAMNSNVFTSELETPHMTVSTTPMFFKLREHHCISPAVPLPHWQVTDDPFDEGIMNAYCPRGFPSAHLITSRDGKLRVRGPPYAEPHVYETYEEGKENSHDEATCRLCEERRIEQRREQMRDVEDLRMVDERDDIADADVDMDDDAERTRCAIQATLPPGLDVEELIARERARGDDDDDMSVWSDAGGSDSASDGGTDISYVCSGIQDIIITGETLPGHALAWGDFKMYGRVRPWDGLIVLIRSLVWLEDDAPPHNTYILRGYLVGGANLVGAWRHVTDSVHSIPFEGPFVVSRVAEVQPREDEAASAVASTVVDAQA